MRSIFSGIISYEILNWSESLYIIKDKIESDGKNTRYRLGGYEDGKGKKADELFLREDLQLIKYPTEIVKIPRVNFRARKVEKAKKTREQLDKEKEEEEKDPIILDETIEV